MVPWLGLAGLCLLRVSTAAAVRCWWRLCQSSEGPRGRSAGLVNRTHSMASHWVPRLFTGKWVQPGNVQEQSFQKNQEGSVKACEPALELTGHLLMVKHESQWPGDFQGIRRHGSLEDSPLELSYHSNLGQCISILCVSFSHKMEVIKAATW